MTVLASTGTVPRCIPGDMGIALTNLSLGFFCTSTPYNKHDRN